MQSHAMGRSSRADSRVHRSQSRVSSVRRSTFAVKLRPLVSPTVTGAPSGPAPAGCPAAGGRDPTDINGQHRQLITTIVFMEPPRIGRWCAMDAVILMGKRRAQCATATGIRMLNALGTMTCEKPATHPPRAPLPAPTLRYSIMSPEGNTGTGRARPAAGKPRCRSPIGSRMGVVAAGADCVTPAQRSLRKWFQWQPYSPGRINP